MTKSKLEKLLVKEALAMRATTRRPIVPHDRLFQVVHVKSYVKGGLRALELLRSEARGGI